MVFAERLQNHPAKKLVCNIHPEWRLFPKTPALHHIDPVIKTVLTTTMFINPKQSIVTILHGLQKKILENRKHQASLHREASRPLCWQKTKFEKVFACFQHQLLEPHQSDLTRR